MHQSWDNYVPLKLKGSYAPARINGELMDETTYKAEKRRETWDRPVKMWYVLQIRVNAITFHDKVLLKIWYDFQISENWDKSIFRFY